MMLIYGLGNAENKYKHTRHNVGFLAISYIAGQLGLSPEKQLCGILIQDDKTIIPIEATGFINNSGKKLEEIVDKYNIDLKDVIVIHDDVLWDVGDFKEFDKIRDSGHNGIKNIIDVFNTHNFRRIAIGIKGLDTEMDMKDFVLSSFVFNEFNLLFEVFGKIYRVLKAELYQKGLIKKEQ